jgi:act minimal PKS chain-length factor (CLF/KS beta)
MTARTVVTGIGVLAPGGIGVERYWQALLDGECAIAPITRFDASGFPARLAGEIRDFDAAGALPGRLVPQTDISTKLALVAADWALQDAKLDDDYADFDQGVVTASGSGGFEFTHREFRKLWSVGPAEVSVYESFAWFYAVNTGQISIRHALRGPGAALVNEQAGGLDALGQARRTVRAGTPLVVTGGMDSALDPWGWASHLTDSRTSRATDPARAYLPFDAAAAGHVPGEGGAFLVVEDADAARRRHAPNRYGEIAGHASTFDPPPRAGRARSNLGRAAALAMRDAEISPAAVDVVFADGAGLPASDRAEAAVLEELFGPHGVPVTAPKAATGRLLSGAGPVDVATALLAIRDDLIPPTPGTTDVPAEYRLDLVTGTPRAARVRCALVLARGKGGFNAAVVVRDTSLTR